MEYYVEYKTHDHTGWKRLNDKPFDVDTCAIGVARSLPRLSESVRDVRVVSYMPSVIWLKGHGE
jgi:hypothetical protein